MKVNKGVVLLFALASFMPMADAFAFSPVPKAAAKALKAESTKTPFSEGVVFVNGKLLEAPYVVQRWGTGIRINKIPVTGQVVPWNEFLKTQPGVRITKVEPKDEAPAPTAEEPAETNAAAESAEAPASADPVAKADSLDEIFGEGEAEKNAKDEGEGEVKTAKDECEEKTNAKPRRKAKAKVVYSIDGPFVENEASKELLKRVRRERTEIEKTLRLGGFICFGDRYPRIVGDSRTLGDLLDKLPRLLQEAADEDDFVSRAKAADIVYLNEIMLRELYANRIDYPRIKRLRERQKVAEAAAEVLDRNDIF